MSDESAGSATAPLLAIAGNGNTAAAAGYRGRNAAPRAAASMPRRSRKEQGIETRRLGSKANGATYRFIINQIPPHHTYLEPFLGWGAIMLHKAAARQSICVDKDVARVNDFLLELSTAHPTMTAALVDTDDVLWSTIGSAAVEDVTRGSAADGRRSAESPRAPGDSCSLLVGDAIDFLAKYPWQGTEFVYCDPPYLHETRTSRHRYLFEMARVDHVALLEVV